MRLVTHPLALLTLAGLLFTGCATNVPMGQLYTDVKFPMDAAAGQAGCSKIGTSEAVSILTLIATGDASINAAVKNGGIKTVKYVDWDVENILGIYGKYTTTVCGD